MAFIELDRATYSYESSSRPAVDSVSLRIEEGEYVALVGANGSGKSTLLRLVAGLRRAGSGAVRVAGLDASVPSNDRAIRSALNLVFQSPPDQIVATVAEEDVAFGPENLGLPREEVVRRVDEALAAVGLEGERGRPPHFLSAGQQQRLAVAGALAMRGRFIAFDEATAMLDPSSRDAMLDIMDGLSARGIGILHVTHDMAEAARARRVVALEAGRIAFDGDPEEFFRLAASGRFALGLPPAADLARRLGLEPRAAESPRELASRIASLLPPIAAGEAGRGARGGAAAGDRRAAVAPRLAASPAGDHAIILDTVSYTYLRGTVNEREALDSATLAVPRGAFVALVGRTGSGKSTVLQLMDALAFPAKGRVLSFGDDTSSPSADLRRLRTRAPLAIQRPESALFEFYAGDDVAYGPRNLGLSGKELAGRARRSMEAVGLPYAEFRDRRTRSLSGGESRKLALAGILALDPEALLLDEPTSALDPASKRAVMELALGQARSGRTVVAATHSMEEAAAADLVALVDQGRITRFEPPREFFYGGPEGDGGLGRPFACALARALAGGRPDCAFLEAEARPLSLDELEAALRPLLAASPAAERRGA